MSDTAREPAVSRAEMRAALARGGARPSRRAPLVADVPEPAWDWQTPESTRELEELRDAIARLEADLDAERHKLRLARAREGELRGGLVTLATARPWNRRRVLAQLRDQRVL